MTHYLFSSSTAKYIWKSIATFGLFTLVQSIMIAYILLPETQIITLVIFTLSFLGVIIMPLWFSNINPKTLFYRESAVKPIPTFIAGYIIVSVIDTLFNFIIGSETYTIAQPNQDLINLVMDNATYLIMPLTVLVAPIVEELIFREWLPKFFRNVGRKLKLTDNTATLLGFIIGSLLFTLMHMPTGLQGWVIYGGLSAVLLYIRYKFSIRAAIMMHFYYNTFVMVALLIGIA